LKAVFTPDDTGTAISLIAKNKKHSYMHTCKKNADPKNKKTPQKTCFNKKNKTFYKNIDNY